MAFGRIIKERGKRLFLSRNTWKGDGLFSMCQGIIYRIHDKRGALWMKVAVRREGKLGIVITDVASGLMVDVVPGRKSYASAIQGVVEKQEFLDNARSKDFYQQAVELCQKEYAELREVGILK